MTKQEHINQLLKALLAQRQQEHASPASWMVLLIEGPQVEQSEETSANLLVQFAYTSTTTGGETHLDVNLELFTSRRSYHIPLDEVTLTPEDMALLVIDLTRNEMLLPDGLSYQVAKPADAARAIDQDLSMDDVAGSHLRLAGDRNARPVWPEPTTPQPDWETLEDWLWADGGCEATDSCWIEVDGVCRHGHPSWLRRLGLI